MHDLSASFLKIFLTRLVAVLAMAGLVYLVSILLNIDPLKVTVVLSLVALVKLGQKLRSGGD